MSELDFEISRIENKTLLERIKALLPTELYEDSKDWREGDVVERVEWLLSMYKWSREDVLRLEQNVLDSYSNGHGDGYNEGWGNAENYRSGE